MGASLYRNFKTNKVLKPMETLITVDDKGVYRKDVESERIRRKLIEDYNRVEKDG